MAMAVSHRRWDDAFVAMGNNGMRRTEECRIPKSYVVFPNYAERCPEEGNARNGK